MRALNKDMLNKVNQEVLPIIPTMDVVVFPHMIVPLLVLDERIIEGINQSLNGSKRVLLLAAKKKIENYQGAIGTNDLYEIGTISSIMRMIKIPEGGVKILVQGISKAQVKTISTSDNILSVSVEEMAENSSENSESINEYIKLIKDQAEKISMSSHAFS